MGGHTDSDYDDDNYIEDSHAYKRISSYGDMRFDELMEEHADGDFGETYNLQNLGCPVRYVHDSYPTKMKILNTIND